MTSLAIPAGRALDRRQRRAEILEDLAAELEINPADLRMGARGHTRAPTVEAAIPPWLDLLAVGKSAATARTYRTGLHRFCEFLPMVGFDPATTPTSELPDDIAEQFASGLAKAYPQQQATVWTYVSALRAFLRFLFRRRWGPAGSSYEVMRLGLAEVMGRFEYKSKRPDPRLATIARHVLALPERPPGQPADALAQLRDRALVVTLLTTGLRVSELVSLNRADLEADPITVVGKGNKERVIFLAGPAREAIAAYLSARPDDSPALFLSHHRNRSEDRARRGSPRPEGRLSAQGVGFIVKRYSAATGIPATPHLFRHRYACDLLASGAALTEIQQLLGHASVAVTSKVYARHDTERLKAAYAQYAERLAGLMLPPA